MRSETDRISTFAAKYFNVREEELYGKKTKADIVMARWIVWYALHTEYKVTSYKLAEEFFRTRRGVMFALAKVRCWLEHQPCFQETYRLFLEKYRES